MSKQKGMSMTGALTLLALGALAAITIDNAVAEAWNKLIHDNGEVTASSPCRVEDGGGISIAGTGINAGSVIDEGCAARQASTIAPDEARKEFMWCSLPSSQRAFGSVQACLNYNGDNDALISRVQETMDYCNRKSKKWYRRITLQRNRSYDRCINKYRGVS